ncbi:MGH1-like glycoside hydrolase domain-containing protein [Trebonia sp.]|uniref:MGH1-like glycoside hydrolase domain-containing protein n=1 Tax=Trebonia sp. TaxID=2767075 RepID=UPI003CC62BD5
MTAGTDVALRDQAAAVLRGNDAGGWTKASPLLYPHQWSWDSAFIAIGWAHLDVRRAMTELEQLFAAQWSTGMVPHIVFRGRSRRAVLSRARVVGLRRRHPGGPRASSADDRDLPAAGARAGGAADLAVDAAAAATGDPRAHPGAVPAAGALAPLPGHRA